MHFEKENRFLFLFCLFLFSHWRKTSTEMNALTGSLEFDARSEVYKPEHPTWNLEGQF